MNKTIALPKGHDRNLLLLRGKAPRGVDISPAFSPPGAAGDLLFACFLCTIRPQQQKPSQRNSKIGTHTRRTFHCWQTH